MALRRRVPGSQQGTVSPSGYFRNLAPPLGFKQPRNSFGRAYEVVIFVVVFKLTRAEVVVESLLVAQGGGGVWQAGGRRNPQLGRSGAPLALRCMRGRKATHTGLQHCTFNSPTSPTALPAPEPAASCCVATDTTHHTSQHGHHCRDQARGGPR